MADDTAWLSAVLIDLEIAHVQLLLMILITGLLEMSEIGRCIG